MTIVTLPPPLATLPLMLANITSHNYISKIISLQEVVKKALKPILTPPVLTFSSTIRFNFDTAPTHTRTSTNSLSLPQ
jgi:hypothetical protein